LDEVSRPANIGVAGSGVEVVDDGESHVESGGE
jgi:hypothetical protein